MIKIKTLFGFFIKVGVFCAFIGVGVLVGGYYYLKPGLPNVEQLRDIRLQTPMRIYSADGRLMAEYGEKRRTPITYEQIPKQFRQAILAAEDSRFYQHMGIDLKGLARAAFELVSTGRIKTGGSTITMQVAKNYFLTRERTFTRKFNEILLALQIEQELSKEEILQLYVNKIYLGNRAYGIQAAANAYYGRNIDQLTLPELAMIAGLPKAPSAYNPIANPTRAIERRNWILSRMLDLHFIDKAAYEQAIDAPVTARYHSTEIELNAPYVTEMVRADLLERYGERIYTDGFKVYTTVRSLDQSAANHSLVNGLLAYDRRHGYRGPERRPFSDDPSVLADPKKLQQKLADEPVFGELQPAVVTAVTDKEAQAMIPNGETITLPLSAVEWAREYKTARSRGPKPKAVSDVLQVGDLIRVLQADDDSWQLSEIPAVQGALVALNPNNGAIRALVGGFDFVLSKFNRATQAYRQPGSNFKPFVYTAALEHGFTPASIINDAPVVFDDKNLESSWRPENDSKKFFGPTRLREALYTSRNLVSIRILRDIGVDTALDYVSRFGFDPDHLPHNLSLALGSADLTPLQVVTGYATFANRGHKVNSYLIERVEEGDKVLEKANPQTVCDGCTYVPPGTEMAAEQSTEKTQITPYPLAPRVVDQRAVYLIDNIMQDVIKRGTGRRAKVLGRNDLAGKTGTTNEQKDAWFSGFNQNLVTSVWVGFDQPETLGREFGSTAALPIWIDFMGQVLDGVPETPYPPPPGIVSVRIDPATGQLAYPGQKDAMFEVFREESVPKTTARSEKAKQTQVTTEELF